MTNSAEQDTFPSIASCAEQGGQAVDHLDGHRVVLAFGSVELAKQTPVERALTLVNANSNIGSVRAMRERNYFRAPQIAVQR